MPIAWSFYSLPVPPATEMQAFQGYSLWVVAFSRLLRIIFTANLHQSLYFFQAVGPCISYSISCSDPFDWAHPEPSLTDTRPTPGGSLGSLTRDAFLLSKAQHIPCWVMCKSMLLWAWQMERKQIISWECGIALWGKCSLFRPKWE